MILFCSVSRVFKSYYFYLGYFLSNLIGLILALCCSKLVLSPLNMSFQAFLGFLNGKVLNIYSLSFCCALIFFLKYKQFIRNLIGANFFHAFHQDWVRACMRAGMHACMHACMHYSSRIFQIYKNCDFLKTYSNCWLLLLNKNCLIKRKFYKQWYPTKYISPVILAMFPIT